MTYQAPRGRRITIALSDLEYERLQERARQARTTVAALARFLMLQEPDPQGALSSSEAAMLEDGVPEVLPLLKAARALVGSVERELGRPWDYDEPRPFHVAAPTIAREPWYADIADLMRYLEHSWRSLPLARRAPAAVPIMDLSDEEAMDAETEASLDV